MKLKTQEKIRTVELILFLGSEVALNLLDLKDSNYKDFIKLIGLPYIIDISSSFRTQMLTDEYKELKKLNGKVISNTKNIIDYIGNNDPISIFATYIYLYRKGYLSYNKKFIYDNNMKNFSSLFSVDVIRGKGVCRSISHALTNIYREFGYDARTLLVNANDESIKNNIHLSNVSLQKSKGGRSFAKIIGKITNIITTPNHAITLVCDKNYGYKLDPTNDCILLNGKLNKLMSPCSNKGIMKNYIIMDLLYSALGSFDNNLNVVTYMKQYKMPNISIEEYKELYLKALDICKKNKKIFEMFYNDNKLLYEEINEISEKQSSYIKRIFPLIPNNKNGA